MGRDISSTQAWPSPLLPVLSTGRSFCLLPMGLAYGYTILTTQVPVSPSLCHLTTFTECRVEEAGLSYPVFLQDFGGEVVRSSTASSFPTHSSEGRTFLGAAGVGHAGLVYGECVWGVSTRLSENSSSSCPLWCLHGEGQLSPLNLALAPPTPMLSHWPCEKEITLDWPHQVHSLSHYYVQLIM